MKNKLYLHIGANKTGSSAVQEFLSKNRLALEAQGYCYPKLGEIYHAHYGISSAFGCGPNGPRVEPVELNALTEKLLEECGNKDCIVSSEYFITLKNASAVIDKLSKSFDLEIIVYFRRHDLWYESLYNQAVKTAINPPWGKGIQAYLNYQWKKGSQTFDYLNIISIWKEHKDIKLNVRPYEKESFKNGDIVDDFMSAVGINISEGFKRNSTTINSSIPLELLDFIDSVNRSDVLNNPEKNRLCNAIVTLSSDKIKSEFKHLINPELRQKILNNQAPNYTKLCKMLGIETPFFKNMDVGESHWAEPPVFDLEQSLKMMSSLLGKYK